MSTTQRVWIGRTLSALAALLLLFSAVMKLVGGEEVAAGFADLELSDSLRVPIGILELACAVVYLLPVTSVLGAVLLTGYLGGAILTHLRVGDPIVLPLVLGGVVWLGLYLREERLWPLLPLRKDRTTS
jgi:hypothetical protein